MRFKIDWASVIVGSKLTVFALFHFVFEGNFSTTSPQGAYICKGDFNGGFFGYRFGGLIFGGTYIHGGAYFQNFTICSLGWSKALPKSPPITQRPLCENYFFPV